MSLERLSPCKVNLLPNILGKRADGFHDLETLMHPVPICDRLVFDRAHSGIRLSCNDPHLPVNSRNLVFRAAQLYLQTAGLSEGVRIHLDKHIPIAAGVGGGSGNAAVTLSAMNELFDGACSATSLAEMAAALGSDVPFFLQPRPALATGRGEKIEPLDFFPALRSQWLVLVHPGFGISTPWAYEQLARFPAARDGRSGRARQLVSLLQTADLSAAASEFYNSLEAPALEKYPLLALFQEFFKTNGARAALMSGSGSATFALMDSEASARQVLEKFKSHFGDKIWMTAVALGLA